MSRRMQFRYDHDDVVKKETTPPSMGILPQTLQKSVKYDPAEDGSLCQQERPDPSARITEERREYIEALVQQILCGCDVGEVGAEAADDVERTPTIRACRRMLRKLLKGDGERTIRSSDDAVPWEEAGDALQRISAAMEELYPPASVDPPDGIVPFAQVLKKSMRSLLMPDAVPPTRSKRNSRKGSGMHD